MAKKKIKKAVKPRDPSSKFLEDRYCRCRVIPRKRRPQPSVDEWE